MEMARGFWIDLKISSFRGRMGYSKKMALILCNYNTKRFLRKLKFGDFYMLFN